MTIIKHPSIAGTLKHVSGSSGGEWAGPCPWCGGEDRFRVWPDHPSGATGGRFLCRGCGRQGDAIQFLRDMERLSYTDACKSLGATPKDWTRRGGRNVRACPVWTPKPSTLPCDAWTAAAGRFVERCAAALAAGGPGLDYARGRGLAARTCAALKIGWNPSDLYEDRAAWGLPEEINERTGKPRRVWQPKGLVIPTLRDGNVVAIKIRRSEWKSEDSLPKYAAVTGSATAPMILAPCTGKPLVVVESELDAILVAQEARDLVCAIALRTAKGKPDDVSHALLQAAPVILVATDADEAGAMAWPWWRSTYPKAKRWPVLSGKDVGDLAATPGLIRAWIEAGLPEPSAAVEPETPSLAGKPTPCRAEDLAHGEPCPYSPDQLTASTASHPHLVCCPATRPHPWWWVERSWCESKCKTPCGRADSAADETRAIQ